MMTLLFGVVGGIGLFLLGMTLLTDGLKTFAGEALQRALVRFTGTPLQAFRSGAVVTALMQSSSATTVAVIGFVSAGLLTFPQAVGMILGASLGTTSTGWLVSILGLKISVGTYALPVVGIGALLHVLGRGRWSAFGLALAGFGLIFVGIETLQVGMRDLAIRFPLSNLPHGGIAAQLLSIVLGFALTVVMQSSSAAVATTLTALEANAVNFEQAILLLIGASGGTIVTAILAAIGANVPARRTAFAHIIFHVANALVAFLLLPLFFRLLPLAQQHLGLDSGPIGLAAFHTLFVAVGSAIFLPLSNPFSRWVMQRMPDRGKRLTAYLDASVLHVPGIALEATRRSLCTMASELFLLVRNQLNSTPTADETARREQIQSALDETRHFFTSIPPVGEEAPATHLRIAVLHAIDHLQRLYTVPLPPAGTRQHLASARLQPMLQLSLALLDLGIAGMQGQTQPDWLAALEQHARDLADLRRRDRPDVLRETAEGRWGPSTAMEALDAMRWIDRLCYHVWRICIYLGDPEKEHPAPVD